MSVENLKEYARRCASEPKLRDRARELGPMDIEGHMREASGMGLDWTMDDMTVFRKELVEAGGEDQLNDLSEEDLEKVAGGAVTAALTAALVAGLVVGSVGVGAVAGAAAGAVVGGAAGGGAAAAGKGGW